MILYQLVAQGRLKSGYPHSIFGSQVFWVPPWGKVREWRKICEERMEVTDVRIIESILDT